MSHSIRKFLVGVFDEEDNIMGATKKIHDQGIKIYDVYTPYAVHGLDEAMGVKRSRLPFVTLVAGLLGCLLAVVFQEWVFTMDWPMIVGGKPHNSLPAFIPVTFELTVLIGGLTTVLAFFIRSRLRPGKKLKILDLNITDNKFVMAIEKVDASLDYKDVEQQLFNLGATCVEERELS